MRRQIYDYLPSHVESLNIAKFRRSYHIEELHCVSKKYTIIIIIITIITY